MNHTQSAIIFPQGYIPGETDNFCSNEVIVKGICLADAWELLVNPHKWPTYYANSANIRYGKTRPNPQRRLMDDLAARRTDNVLQTMPWYENRAGFRLG